MKIKRYTYLEQVKHLKDAFLFSACKRYGVKGKSCFEYPNKYYCEDVGLRNAASAFASRN